VLFGLYLVLVILDFGMSRKYQDVYLINVGRTEINVGRTEINVGRTERCIRLSLGKQINKTYFEG